MPAAQEKRTCYFYHEEIGNFTFGGGNPMRPHRARLVYSLLKAYGLASRMSIQRPPAIRAASFEQLTEFHADDYIDFLRTVTPNNAEDHLNQLKRFNMGQIGDVDCPVFDGVYDYCTIYSGGSVNGAANLAEGRSDLAFNWSGGMHHAKKAEASGFCYVNDIVLAILELLKAFPRVLYVDIDIHHGDGVEEAFYLTDRVMTVSFHKYGEFFPGTGALADIGFGKGKFYTVNVPLKDGMDDDNYQMMYEPIMAKVMEMYQPGAIVMCCGADSLSGDKLGCFNLSMEGHSHCIEFLARYNVPMLVLGGGGYTLRNVARCWCYETGRMMGVDLPDQLPGEAVQDYNYYLDTGALRISVSNMKNMNTREELLEIKRRVLEHLAQLPPVPSAQMTYNPPSRKPAEAPEDDPDVRGGGQEYQEHLRVKAGDESDAEEDAPHAPRTDYVAGDTDNGAADGQAVKAEPLRVKEELEEDTKMQEEGAGADMQPATLDTSEALHGSPTTAGQQQPLGAGTQQADEGSMDIDGPSLPADAATAGVPLKAGIASVPGSNGAGAPSSTAAAAGQGPNTTGGGVYTAPSSNNTGTGPTGLALNIGPGAGAGASGVRQQLPGGTQQQGGIREVGPAQGATGAGAGMHVSMLGPSTNGSTQGTAGLGNGSTAGAAPAGKQDGQTQAAGGGSHAGQPSIIGASYWQPASTATPPLSPSHAAMAGTTQGAVQGVGVGGVAGGALAPGGGGRAAALADLGFSGPIDGGPGPSAGQ